MDDNDQFKNAKKLATNFIQKENHRNDSVYNQMWHYSKTKQYLIAANVVRQVIAPVLAPSVESANSPLCIVLVFSGITCTLTKKVKRSGPRMDPCELFAYLWYIVWVEEFSHTEDCIMVVCTLHWRLAFSQATPQQDAVMMSQVNGHCCSACENAFHRCGWRGWRALLTIN